MKRALVTGASSGIGKCFAQMLAQRGYAITLVSRSEATLAEIAQRLPGEGHRWIRADLSSQEETQRVCMDVEQTRYDLLINNAGVGLYGPLTDSTWEDLTAMHRLNCDALLALSYAFLKRAVPGNALINVASVLGLLPFPQGGAHYGATKAFVVSLTQALWEEQRHRGVYVMALCPGVTETNFYTMAGGDPAKPPPHAVTQTAEDVVLEALNALDRRALPVVVTGWKNRLLVLLMRFLSRKRIANIMAKAKPHRRTPE